MKVYKRRVHAKFELSSLNRSFDMAADYGVGKPEKKKSGILRGDLKRKISLIVKYKA